jgi:hypothetical protein
MSPTLLRKTLAKQRQINRRLREQLRAETMLVNALSDLRWHKKDQTPAALQRVRDAIALRESLASGHAPQTSYPVSARQAA